MRGEQGALQQGCRRRASDSRRRAEVVAPLPAVEARRWRSAEQGRAGDARGQRAALERPDGERDARGGRGAQPRGRVAGARPRAREQRQVRVGLRRDARADAGDGAEAGRRQRAGEGPACSRGWASPRGQAMARELARQQRGVARDLERARRRDGGKSEELAREAQRIAEALDAGRARPGNGRSGSSSSSAACSTRAARWRRTSATRAASARRRRRRRARPSRPQADGARARRREVPRADVERAARADARRAARGPRVLQADQRWRQAVAGAWRSLAACSLGPRGGAGTRARAGRSRTSARWTSRARASTARRSARSAGAAAARTSSRRCWGSSARTPSWA